MVTHCKLQNIIDEIHSEYTSATQHMEKTKDPYWRGRKDMAKRTLNQLSKLLYETEGEIYV